MHPKMYYTTCGFVLTFANIVLIDTRFNLVGGFFGFLAVCYFLTALGTKR